MKISVLSNVTFNIVADSLKKSFEVYCPDGYDTWQMEIADSCSGLYAYAPDVIFAVLYIDKYGNEWQTPEEGRKYLDNWLETLGWLCRTLRSTPVFVSDLDLETTGCGPVSPYTDFSELEAYWIKRLQELRGIDILPVKDAVRGMGREQFYSRKMWYMGNFPYSLKGAKMISGMIERHCGYLSGAKKKCLVVDLDNTLWGGAIGEDGVDGIELSNHREGARFYDAQKCLKQMKDHGVMLAIASKNNPEDVYPVFEHPFMCLKKEDFVSIKINWACKSQNLQEMANELNIGTDAFVFLDDNPNEREQMKSACPEVTVIEFPKDTSMLPQILENVYRIYFKGMRMTDEDRLKTNAYRQREKRKGIRAGAKNVEEYLDRLEITADIHQMRKAELARVVQLAGKTNQFNTTTIRYSEKELLELSENKNGDIVVAYMEDRYGNEGLTAVVTIRYTKDTAIFEDFIMSCRVMGRKFENVIFDSIVTWLKDCHPEIAAICCDYVKTAKNKPVEHLYESFGFQIVSAEGDVNEMGYTKRYCFDINGFQTGSTKYKLVHAFERGRCITETTEGKKRIAQAARWEE